MPSQDTWTPIKNLQVPTATGRIRSWQNTPNFGALANDSKPVNPYYDKVGKTVFTRTLQQWTSASGATGVNYYNYELTPHVARTTCDSDFLNTAEWIPLCARLANDSTLKALVKIADAKVNISVALAEAGKTSDLILDTARRIDRAYRAFRKGDLRGIAKNLNITPKRLHKSWLEYKYGWMPLLMDVKGAAEFFAQQHCVRPPRFNVVARESAVKHYVRLSYASAYGSTVPNDYLTTVLYSGNRTVTTKIWCELSYPHLAELQQLGVTNPLLVAWELVPYSFVFDWFISVGDWLTGLTALNGVTVRRAMRSAIETRVWQVKAPRTTRYSGSGSGLITYSMNERDWLYTERWYERDIPSLSIYTLSPPRMKSFGFQKLVTSLALIQGSHRGNSRL